MTSKPMCEHGVSLLGSCHQCIECKCKCHESKHFYGNLADLICRKCFEYHKTQKAVR